MDNVSLFFTFLLTITVFSLLWRIDRRSRRTERNLIALMSHLGVGGSEPPEPSASVRALVADRGANVAAIKAYRAETGLGLVEAKEAIDRIVTLRSHENV